MSAIAFILPLTSDERKNVLIADDTLYSRNRSKKVDMLTRVYDHTTCKYVKGFKLLTLAWSDGNTTIPVRFRHLVSTNEKMIINPLPKNMDKRTRSYKLRRSAQRNPKVKIHNTDNEEMNAKIIFLSTNKDKYWIALLSTNTALDDEEIIRIYGKRWNIEVMFKTSKSFLHLDSELQSLRFESIYAHTAIVYLRYIMLAYESRVSQDSRTCGELFFIICDELKDISYLEALTILLTCFINAAKDQLILTEEQISCLLGIFMAQIPHCFKKC